MRELSLFSGAGIGALAAREAGVETVAFCESDPWCQHALRGLWPGVPVFGDVRTLTADALPAGIDIISGGWPCVDISCAGKGAGIHAERSGLWFQMLRLVREVRPRWVLAENVSALRTRGADVVIAGLEAAGYTVWPLVVGAEDAGAPHRRKRVWIVGHSDGNGRKDQDALLQGQSEPDRAMSPSWPLRPGEIHRIPRAHDGLAGSLPPSARRAALRILGNGWVPQIPHLIYRWIVAQEGNDRG